MEVEYASFTLYRGCLVLAIHLLNFIVVEELTSAVFQLVLLITHVLLDLCGIFLSQERTTAITFQLRLWVKVDW